MQHLLAPFAPHFAGYDGPFLGSVLLYQSPQLLVLLQVETQQQCHVNFPLSTAYLAAIGMLRVSLPEVTSWDFVGASSMPCFAGLEATSENCVASDDDGFDDVGTSLL